MNFVVGSCKGKFRYSEMISSLKGKTNIGKLVCIEQAQTSDLKPKAIAFYDALHY